MEPGLDELGPDTETLGLGRFLGIHRAEISHSQMSRSNILGPSPALENHLQVHAALMALKPKNTQRTTVVINAINNHPELAPFHQASQEIPGFQATRLNFRDETPPPPHYD